jgi:hypothetical protein
MCVRALTNQRTNLKNDILYLRWLTKKIYVCACVLARSNNAKIFCLVMCYIGS